MNYVRWGGVQTGISSQLLVYGKMECCFCREKFEILRQFCIASNLQKSKDTYQNLKKYSW